MQTYMSFSVGNKTSYFNKKSEKQVEREFMNLRFIDSFGFMASSLSQLVVDLKQGGLDKFKNVSEEFVSDVELTELVTRKGIYFYSFMDSCNEFNIDPLILTHIMAFDNEILFKFEQLWTMLSWPLVIM